MEIIPFSDKDKHKGQQLETVQKIECSLMSTIH